MGEWQVGGALYVHATCPAACEHMARGPLPIGVALVCVPANEQDRTRQPRARDSAEGRKATLFEAQRQSHELKVSAQRLQPKKHIFHHTCKYDKPSQTDMAKLCDDIKSGNKDPAHKANPNALLRGELVGRPSHRDFIASVHTENRRHC